MANRMLVLENGKVMYGDGFGSSNTRIAEIVFNTSMVGYQEILSDSSYCGQIAVMSYPLIGNYGLTDDDYESKNIFISGFVVRDYNDNPSNFRFTRTLSEVMNDANVPGISGVDTRELVRIIREEGTMRAMITDADRNVDECVKELKEYVLPRNQVKTVSSKKIWYSRTKNPKYNVVAIDCGIMLNSIRELNAFGCNVIVVPYDTAPVAIEKLNPDGLFFSNGPGNPTDVPEVLETARYFRGKLPIFGVSLGHQILGMAYGAKTYKMKFGHRGTNHPVKNLATDKIEITNQNHSYSIMKNSIEGSGLKLTHVDLLDGEVEGVSAEKDKMISVQFYPENAVGREESEYVYTKFTNFMDVAKGEKSDAEKNRY